MKKLLLLASLLLTFTLAFAQEHSLSGKKVLVFSKTMGFRHTSIPQGIACVEALGRKYGFAVTATEDSEQFNEANLKNFSAVVFMSTTGNVLNANQQTAFERFIQAGGGYVGVHAASDTEYDWPWYGKLVGGYFEEHPGNPNVREGQMGVVEATHPATEGLPQKFTRKDEFYDFKNMNPAVKPLITVDEKSYNWKKMGDNHPLSWFHEYDGGRAFYTNFGHTEETFMEPLFLQHLWGGIRWAAPSKPLDYAKAHSQVAPEDNRFTIHTLDEKLYEPTELAVLSNTQVVYGQRHGEIKFYDRNATQKVQQLAKVDVYDKFEYGLMGLAPDPNFATNNWLYLFYAPSVNTYGTDTSSRLVRVKFYPEKAALDWTTEQILLRVPVKRAECCHTGGSIAFDKNNNLYLSTGDDTNPFASDGFAPIDERPDRAGWDARATSSNTNDYRGKVLRIKPNQDGTSGYSIPDGNLFPPNTPQTKPEIYAMGMRNPYRISVDQRNGFLYWGDVGPDAGDDKPNRGSRGHDEVNQARKAGYFGWPLFIADNKPYNAYNFTKKETGEAFNPEKPLNDSPHNTGLTTLPAANKAFIYYPYADSPVFGSIIGKGGRNAMAGPVFYSDDYEKNSSVKFPSYYDGKFFAYDWMRDFVNIVTMKPNGDFDSMERFMPSAKFSHPIDMAFAPDGSLFMLEYGPNWFAQNDEARLTQFTFNPGNRTPFAKATVSQTAGGKPLKVKFSSEGSLDYDNDALKYSWKIQGKTINNPSVEYTFTKAGVYPVVLTVTDALGNAATSQLEIRVGNHVPTVEMTVAGNQTFFFENQPIQYEVKVADKEDGSLANKKIPEDDVVVNIDFLEGFDKTLIAQGHQANTSFASGKRLIELSDCKACHATNQKSVGPSYADIAKKYRGQWMIEGKLADKIRLGGGGVWGEQAMAAHPQITKVEATEMVNYILSIGDTKKTTQPVRGQYQPKNSSKSGTYLLAASYTDRGGAGLPPLSAQKTITLRSNKLAANSNDENLNTFKYKIPSGQEVIVGLQSGSFVGFKGIDLTGIGSVACMAMSPAGQTVGGKLELRLGSPTGKLLGTATIPNPSMGSQKIGITEAVTGSQNVYLVFVNPEAKAGQPLFALDTIVFERK